MKIRNLLVGAAAALAVLVGCQPQEENLGTPDISISTNEMTFDVAGGDQELTVTATRDWKVETDADWVVVSPESGSASSDPKTVTVSVLENTGMDRSADLKFTIGMKSKYLTVSQTGPGGSTADLMVYHNDFDVEKAQNNSGWPYLDSNYDLWDNKEGTGAETVTYAFGGKMSVRTSGKLSNDGSGYSHYAGSGMNKVFFGAATSILKVQNITLDGTSTNYTLSFGGQKYGQDEPDNSFSFDEFKIYLSNDSQKWVPVTMAFPEGADIVGDWNLATASFTVPSGTTSLGIAFVCTKSSVYSIDDLLLEIGTEAGQAIDFASGIEITGTTEGSGGQVTPPSDITDVTVAEFNTKAVSSTDWYRLTGKVKGPINTQYGNYDLVDDTGTVYVYGTSNWSDFSSDFAEGGTVTVVGQRGEYNGKIEVLESYIESYIPGEGGEDPVPPVGDGTLVTIADVLASSGALASGTVIEGVVISNMALNNLTSKKGMYVQDETAALQFYLAENHSFAFGDKVRIDLSSVSVGEYNGAVQVSGLALSKITKLSSGNTVTPKVVSIDDFLANKYEGQYIAIEGIQVADADLSKTFVMGGAHTSITVENAEGKSFAIFSSKYASYGTTTVPQGSGTIKGISSISKGDMQIIFAQSSDFAGLTGTRFDGTEVTPPSGGGEDPVTPPAGGEGQYEPNITWTLGNKAYDNTSGNNAQYGTVNGVSVENMLKLGTGSLVGDATLHVPAGTTKLGFYCIAWKGKTAQVKFSIGGNEITKVSPAANAGATGNPPYTITLADADYYEVEMPSTEGGDVKVETLDNSNGRAIFIGIKAITE